MPKSKEKRKKLPRLILEKLLDIAKSYTAPLTYQETEMLYNALGVWGKGMRPHHYNQTLKRLDERGLVKIRKGPKIQIAITAKGKNYLKGLRQKNIQVNKPIKWDKKWRLVIFDVPEKEQQKRRHFRDHLKNLGFTQVQKSVWAYPYPCSEEIAALCSMHHVKPFVSIFEGVYLGRDIELKKIFGL